MIVVALLVYLVLGTLVAAAFVYRWPDAMDDLLVPLAIVAFWPMVALGAGMVALAWPILAVLRRAQARGERRDEINRIASELLP